MIKDGQIVNQTQAPGRIEDNTDNTPAGVSARIIKMSKQIERVFSAVPAGAKPGVAEFPKAAMDLLKKIERNTAMLVSSGLKQAKTATARPSRSERSPKPQRAAKPIATKEPPPKKPLVSSKTTTDTEKKPGKQPAAPIAEKTVSKPPVKTPVSIQEPPAATATAAEALSGGTPAPGQQPKSAPGPKSEAAQKEQRAKKDQQKQAEIISDSVSRGIDGWGMIKGALARVQDVGDAEGTADIVGSAAGPFWEAAKEIKEAADTVRDELGDDEAILGKVFQKAKGMFEGRGQPKAPAGWKQDKAGKWRDESGKFVKKAELEKRGLTPQPTEKRKSPERIAKAQEKRVEKKRLRARPSRTEAETMKILDEQLENQEEFADASIDVSKDMLKEMKDASKDERKRHRRLLRAIGKGGGLFGGGGGLMGALRSVIGKAGGGIASLVGGGLIFKHLFGDKPGAPDIDPSKDASKTAEKTSKAADKTKPKKKVDPIKKGASEGASKGAKKAATVKAAKKAATKVATKSLGAPLAAALSLIEGIRGYRDKDLHKEAFDLEEGEDASTGQKAASALAKMFDMGGLATSIAGAYGKDTKVEDIAKGIHGSFDLPREHVKDIAAPSTAAGMAMAPTATAKPIKKVPEPIRTKQADVFSMKTWNRPPKPKEITQEDQKRLMHVSPAGATSRATGAGAETKQLTMAVQQLVKTQQRKSQPPTIEQNIPTEFEGDLETLIAHDRI